VEAIEASQPNFGDLSGFRKTKVDLHPSSAAVISVKPRQLARLPQRLQKLKEIFGEPQM
jgi:hypothetical protein